MTRSTAIDWTDCAEFKHIRECRRPTCLECARIASLIHHTDKDAERYRWLKAHYDGVDFDYVGDGSTAALIFDWPKGGKVSADLDATIDAVIDGRTDGL